MRLKLPVVFAIIANIFLKYANAQVLISPVVAPVRPNCPTVNFQMDTDTICGINTGGVYAVQATASGSNLRVEWTTSGQGEIGQSSQSSGNNLVANYGYTPGEGQGAYIDIYVTVRDTLSRCAAVTDTLRLRIADAPRIRFPDYQDPVCGSSPVYIEPELLGEVSTVYWTATGDGYFSPNPGTSTFYYPGINDRRDGAFSFYAVTNDPPGPCGAASASSYFLFKDGVIDAGPDTMICAETGGGIFYPAVGIYPYNYYPGLSWTTNGSGTFDDSNSQYTGYNYTPADAAKGEVELYVTDVNSCGTFTDTLKVRLQQKPGLRFTNEIVRGCGRRPRVAVEVILSGAATGGRWSTTGSGYFENPTSLRTVYFAGTSDLGRRSLGLKFTTNDPDGPCTSDSGVIKAYFSTYCVGRKSAVDEQLSNEQTIISVYPNPVKDVLHINGGSAIAKNNFRLTDIAGKAVPFNWEGNSSINVASLKPGIYFVHCTSNGRRQTFKVIKL